MVTATHTVEGTWIGFLWCAGLDEAACAYAHVLCQGGFRVPDLVTAVHTVEGTRSVLICIIIRTFVAIIAVVPASVGRVRGLSGWELLVQSSVADVPGVGSFGVVSGAW